MFSRRMFYLFALLGLYWTCFVNVSAQEATDPWLAIQTVSREIPAPSKNPGNVFFENQMVSVHKSTDPAAIAWQIKDEEDQTIAEGNITISNSDNVTLGRLGIGWYKILWLNSQGHPIDWTTAAVIARLQAPTPQNSPICIDAATSWFAKNDSAQQSQYARLASIAGINWIRDRIRRRDLQPNSPNIPPETQYDLAAKIQAQHGLKLLQVHHDTPTWAITDGGGTGRFPGDLRHIYDFGKALSNRFKDTVQAWEPWNEANVPNFGGHTMDEICSYQKAAYLGYKAGNPQATVCWNVTTGVPTARQTECVLENETWPYFDTYNIHTYDLPGAYLRLWKPVREAASGKPIWITESDRGIPCERNSPTKELSNANNRLKAQFIAQSYANSLYAGANRHFHFILGQYSEGTTQFGLLRQDLTPRASYVALAATGRLLAGARCLGKVALQDQPNVHLVAFQAYPDGKQRDVLVAWAERQVDWHGRGKTTSAWPIEHELNIEQSYDYLGRPLATQTPTKLTGAPVFLVLPAGECEKLTLHAPSLAQVRSGEPTPIVMQCLMPKETSQPDKSIRWASQFEHTVDAKQNSQLPIYLYNFSNQTAAGTIAVEKQPNSIQISLPTDSITLAPMQRKKVMAQVKFLNDGDDYNSSNWIKLRGEFADAGRPVLAFRLVPTSKLPSTTDSTNK